MIYQELKCLNDNHQKDCPCFCCDPIGLFKPGQIWVPNGADKETLDWGPIKIEAINPSRNRLIYSYPGGHPSALGKGYGYSMFSLNVSLSSNEFKAFTEGLDSWGVTTILSHYSHDKR